MNAPAAMDAISSGTAMSPPTAEGDTSARTAIRPSAVRQGPCITEDGLNIRKGSESLAEGYEGLSSYKHLIRSG